MVKVSKNHISYHGKKILFQKIILEFIYEVYVM
jgi:hypothetical protein